MTSIWRLPAGELASRIRAREMSSRDVVEAFLTRIQALDGQVNAFALLDAEGALKAADAADNALASGTAVGSLHGVPVSVKDLVATRGMVTAFGSHAFADNVPAEDAEAVARLRAAGAIIIGKTTTPELGHKVLTDSPAYGYTRNPWDVSKSPGGSSGGAAVSAAMGFSPLAVSTDGAGSGRIPASCCGIVGLKPTIGAVPHETNSDLFGSLTCIGAMARSVSDTALLYSVMHGPDPRDPWSLAGNAGPVNLPPDPIGVLKGLRIRYLPRTQNSYLDPEVERLCASMVARLEGEGAEVRDDDPIGDWNLAAALKLMRAYQAARFGHLLDRWRDRMDPALVEGLEQGRAFSGEEVAHAIADRTRHYRSMQSLFADADVLVTPTVSVPSLDIEQRSNEPLVLDGNTLGPLRETWYCYTIPFNPSGNPAISVPCGFSGAGLPVGLQIVGPWHSEPLLLSIAAAIEALSPWADRWPALAVEGNPQ